MTKKDLQKLSELLDDFYDMKMEEQIPKGTTLVDLARMDLELYEELDEAFKTLQAELSYYLNN